MTRGQGDFGVHTIGTWHSCISSHRVSWARAWLGAASGPDLLAQTVGFI